METNQTNDELEIDLIDLCKFLLSRWMWLLLGLCVGVGIAFGATKMLNETNYVATKKLYVTVPKTSDKVLIRDSASELTADYIQIFSSDLVLDEIADRLHMKKSKISKKITVEQQEGARIVNVIVTTSSRQETKKIAKQVVPAINHIVVDQLGKNQLTELTTSTKVEVVETMSLKKNLLIGAAAGFFLIAGVFFVIYLVRISRKQR